ncbi:ATP-binding cassette domain-containing protein [Candidatus Poribacteria bacterium]|nr:ATP-binding cassette domain-containing protein [Candidatus Poribacteria bacterium]
MNLIAEAKELSKWYGQVIGVNKITIDINPGVTGLLGPNGAGKSTFLKLMVGLLKPSSGSIQVLGMPVWNNPDFSCRIGYCPEQDAFYRNMTGVQFVTNLALLSGYSRYEAREKAMKALETVRLVDNKDRKVGAYSKGMRQRIKLAQSLLHDPELLFLDEPLNGMDPISRRNTIRLVKELEEKGKSIIVSSHILHEIESMTNKILLISNGRIRAEGDVHEIRELIDEHPHNVHIICNKPRLMAAILVEYEDVASIRINAEDNSLVAETLKPDDFYSRLPEIVIENDIEISNLYSPDDNLQAVFKYLVG